MQAGYVDALGPAAELPEVPVEVGRPHPQKQQGILQPETSHAGLISAHGTGPLGSELVQLFDLRTDDAFSSSPCSTASPTSCPMNHLLALAPGAEERIN